MQDDEARPPDPAPDAPLQPHVSLREIFMLFFEIGALSFGGGLTAWLYREVAEKRKLLTEADFIGGMTLAQVLPGINMTNMAVYVGQRLRGVAGTIVALLGLVTLPFFAVITFASLYSYIQAVPTIQHFFDGMAAAAVGMIFSMGVKAVRVTRMQGAQLLIAGILVVTIGILRWPMIPVILIVVPFSVWLSWPRKGVGNA